MSFTDYLGWIGGLLLLIKIGLHFYIRSSLNKKTSADDIGQYTKPMYFFPIFDALSGNLKIIKILANVIYILALILIIIFLIAENS